VTFWGQVAKQFGNNKLVFYELYNEPHLADFNVFVNGNDQYAGMWEMYQAVRTYTSDSMIIIGGQQDYAYDPGSLVNLEKQIGSKLSNVLYNFHPYMGPYQQGDKQKTAEGFDAAVAQVSQTQRPIIVTEFGQYCCPSDGVCFDYPGNWQGQNMGYVEAILQICQKHGVSWLGWAWRPQANTADCDSPDMNGDNGNPLKLSPASSGQGANWAKLFVKYF